MEELFDGQLSFADIDAEKFLQVRRAHADRRVNAMDRLTDDVINELIQLCLPHYHIKAGETVQQGRPYTRLETMVRVHLLQVSLNLSDPEMESYLASDMVARSFCRVSSTRLFISDSTILRFRHFIDQYGLAQKLVHLGSPWNAALTFKKKSGRLPPRKKVALTPNFRQIQVTREEPRKKDERYDQYCRATFQISRSMARLPDHFFQDSSLARRWQEDSNS